MASGTKQEGWRSRPVCVENGYFIAQMQYILSSSSYPSETNYFPMLCCCCCCCLSFKARKRVAAIVNLQKGLIILLQKGSRLSSVSASASGADRHTREGHGVLGKDRTCMLGSGHAKLRMQVDVLDIYLLMGSLRDEKELHAVVVVVVVVVFLFNTQVEDGKLHER